MAKENHLILAQKSIVAASLLFPCFILAGCSTPSVPVYEGMSIAKASTPTVFSDSLRNPQQENPSSSNVDITSLVTPSVTNDSTVQYFVKKGETFIVQVHLSNPNDFEIQSFTLNGKKYANYMFKEGSTLELLLLEVTAPETGGYTDYTIDAIKYIDGTEIKDVKMEGEKTIQAGVGYGKEPSASLTSLDATTNSLSFKINLVDPESVLQDHPATLYLGDASKVIFQQDLVLGSQAITINSLAMGTSYGYGISASYDMADGKGLANHWLLNAAASTKKAFSFSSVSSTQTSISFALNKNSDDATLASIELYDQNTLQLVQRATELTATSFSALLSNHAYQLRANFTLTSIAESVSDYTSYAIKTLAKSVPTVSLVDQQTDSTSLSGRVNVTDPDGVYTLNSVALLDANNTLVQTTTDSSYSFKGLSPYTAYTVRVTYHYDLNDGVGSQEAHLDQSYKTNPSFEFTSVSILNTSPVSEGDTIVMEASINNPSNATYRQVTINGKTYSVSSASRANFMRVEIVNEGQFAGGQTTLTIESVACQLDGASYIITPSHDNSASIFVNGALAVKSIEVASKVGTSYEARDYLFPSDDAYYYLTIDNPTGYTINDIKIAQDKAAGTPIDYPSSAITIVDANHLALKASLSANATAYCSLYSLSYSNTSLDKTKKYSGVEAYFSVLGSDTVIEITSASQLRNQTSNAYCLLKNDIDLAGLAWDPTDFSGVLDGKGYSIRNLSCVKTISEGSFAYGVFQNVRGVMKDLNIADEVILINAKPTGGQSIDCALGGLAASFTGKASNLANKDTAGKSAISLSGSANTPRVGGLFGQINNANMSACRNESKVSGLTNVGGLVGASSSSTILSSNSQGSITGNAPVGGIVGRGEKTIINASTNSSQVNGTGMGAGGIVGEIDGSVSACRNTATITGEKMVGGIAGECNGASFTKNTNQGSISGSSDIGGILGSSNSQTLDYVGQCVNSGSVSGATNVGGIAGDAAPLMENCFNSGTVSTSDIYAGGICGWLNGSLTNCLNVGSVTGKGMFRGGIVGHANTEATSTLTSCLYLGSPSLSAIGQASTTLVVKECHYDGEKDEASGFLATSRDELNQVSFYTDTLGWDATLWDLTNLDVANNHYPTLR